MPVFLVQSKQYFTSFSLTCPIAHCWIFGTLVHKLRRNVQNSKLLLEQHVTVRIGGTGDGEKGKKCVSAQEAAEMFYCVTVSALML